MIGQESLKNTLNKVIDNGKFPRSSIICGIKGSGKRLIANYIANKLNYQISILPDVKMDTVREVIELSCDTIDPTIYVFPNIDEAQFRVKYTLLKILEEQPNNAYFILTCRNLDNLYDAIKSRCQIYYMDNYSPNEIYEFANTSYKLTKEELDIVMDICETPSEVTTLIDNNISDFNNYVQLVIKNINHVPLANAFKIGNKLSMKKDSKGFDLDLFFRMINKYLVKDPTIQNINAIKVTSDALSELSLPSINKNMLFDTWVVKMREVL